MMVDIRLDWVYTGEYNQGVCVMKHKAEHAKMKLLEHARFLDAPVVQLKRYSKAEVAAAVAEAKERDKAKAWDLINELSHTNEVYGDGDI